MTKNKIKEIKKCYCVYNQDTGRPIGTCLRCFDMQMEARQAGKLEVLQELMDELSEMKYQGGTEEGDPTVIDWEDVEALIQSKIEELK